MIITSTSQPENAVAGTLWRKEKTGEVRMADGKGGWVTPTAEVLAHHGLASNPVEAKRETAELTPEQIEKLKAARGIEGGAK